MLLTYAYDVLINVAVLMLLTYDVLINVAVFMLLTYDRLINVAVPMLLKYTYDVLINVAVLVRLTYSVYCGCTSISKPRIISQLPSKFGCIRQIDMCIMILSLCDSSEVGLLPNIFTDTYKSSYIKLCTV
jgi:hypothetical protein